MAANSDQVVLASEWLEIISKVRRGDEYLEFLSDILRDDKQIVIEAVRHDQWALYYTSDRLRNDKEVVLAAVSSYAGSLFCASEELHNDKDVVLAAIKQGETSGVRAIKYASEDLSKDPDVIDADRRARSVFQEQTGVGKDQASRSPRCTRCNLGESAAILEARESILDSQADEKEIAEILDSRAALEKAVEQCDHSGSRYSARAFSAMAELRAAASRKPGVDYKTMTEDDRGRGQTSTREATEEMKKQELEDRIFRHVCELAHRHTAPW